MVKAACIGIGEEPRIIEFDDDLETLQNLVGGLIEPFNAPFGDEPLLWVNDSGMFESEPNRAVFATREMEEMGYLSPFDLSPVREGQLYTVLFGPIVAVSYELDDEGERRARDITDGEYKAVCSALGNAASGREALLSLTLVGIPKRNQDPPRS